MGYNDVEQQRQAQRESYLRNKDKIMIKQRVRRKSAKIRLNEYKRVHSCKDCGGEFPPCVMEFHHNDGDKEMAVAQAVRHLSWERVLREIEKCDLLCANCHRIREHVARGCCDIDAL